MEIEERVARLEGRVDEHSRFFESISVKLTLLEDKGDRNREGLEDKIDKRTKELDDKIEMKTKELEDKIDKRAKEFDDKIEIRTKELNDKIDRNKEDLEKKIDKNREEIERLRHEMHVMFRWIVGIQITTWITILLAIVFK